MRLVLDIQKPRMWSTTLFEKDFQEYALAQGLEIIEPKINDEQLWPYQDDFLLSDDPGWVGTKPQEKFILLKETDYPSFPEWLYPDDQLKHVRKVIQPVGYRHKTCYTDLHGESNRYPFLDRKTYEEVSISTATSYHKDLDIHLLQPNFWSEETFAYKYGTPELELMKRPIDVCFVGSGTHYDNKSTVIHRKLATEAIRNLSPHIIICNGMGEQHEEWIMTRFGTRFPMPHQHFELLTKSKIAISPFGYGESCIRDFEALLAGCILVKPDCRYVCTDFDLYTNSWFTNFCKQDFSDLSDIIEIILQNLASKSELINGKIGHTKVQDKRRLFLDYITNKENLVTRLKTILNA